MATAETVSIRDKFFAGDYEGVCIFASRAGSVTGVKSFWFRALVALGRSSEAKQLTSNGTSALDIALLLYSDAYPLRALSASLKKLVPKAVKASSIVEGKDEAAVVLSTFYSWLGNLTEAYRVAALSPDPEA